MRDGYVGKMNGRGNMVGEIGEIVMELDGR